MARPRAHAVTAVATAACITFANCPVAAGAQQASAAPPRFRQGTPYSQVRRQLIAAGWSPYRMANRGCRPDYAWCRPLPETVTCSSTGNPACTFSWRRGQRFLLVTAVGEMDDQRFRELRTCLRLTMERLTSWPLCR